jgi:Bacterial Ig-like domain
VVLTGSTQPGNTVSVQWNGSMLNATVAADGSWTVNFPASGIRGGEYDTTATVTARDAAGNSATDTHAIRVDTVTSVNIDANQLGGDNIESGAEAANGIVLTGTAQAGASVAVTFEGVTRTVIAGANGAWAANYTAAEVHGGTYDSIVRVTATDTAGNTASDTHTVRVDTEAPDSPNVQSFTRDAAGLRGIGTDATEDVYSFTRVNADGSTTAISATRTDDLPFNETNFAFRANTVPDGSYLVVNTADEVGNSSSTLLIVDNRTATHVDLTRAGLSGFDFSAIDLTFAPDARLSITEAQLNALTGPDHHLVIKGDAGDTVTMTGAVDTGVSQVIDGQTYTVYSLGSHGATVLLDDDIQSVI